MLGSDVLTDINATIGMNRLSTEVTEKLNQEKTTTNYNAPSIGSLLAVPYGSDAPAGYSLYQRGEPKELVWEEKAPVSVARMLMMEWRFWMVRFILWEDTMVQPKILLKDMIQQHIHGKTFSFHVSR